MKSNRRAQGLGGVGRSLALLLVLLAGAALTVSAQSFTLSVVDEGGAAVPYYRWLLQEDTTHAVVPGVSAGLSLGFHRSYAPPVASGDQSSGPIAAPDPAKRYFISVLPSKLTETDQGYTMSGAPVPAGVAAGTVITVNVHRHPIPTAQISVKVFHDNFPVNNILDQPAEDPGPDNPSLQGFKITLEDAGGGYGHRAAFQMTDAFGNPLGTVYGQDGNIVQMGNGVITTDANGEALIKNLAPGKYGVSVVPPAGQGWIQTSTIEGTHVNDAWVKPGEPPFFVEFGPPGYHAFFGFVQPMHDTGFLSGAGHITGTVRNVHNSRPPDFTFYAGAPVVGAMVGLNSAPAGTGYAVHVSEADENGYFDIPDVPPGTYELVVWDKNLDVIFDARDVTIATDGEVLALGDVLVFNWFGRLEHNVFEDLDGDGFRDPGEIGIPEQAINLRFRDGSIYQSFPTDGEGFVPFDEVFPFFNWLVAEVDFTRYKATGVTVTVDAGGPLAPGEVLNPQPQTDPATGLPDINPNTGDNLSRTETGPVLTEAFQVFLGQTNVLDWGKAPYGPGENGGITGIVYYASTRAENDPVLAAAEFWEPGIPRVQVNLYQDSDRNGQIDPLGPGGPTPDVDLPPYGWAEGGARGAEDIDYDGDGIFDLDGLADVDNYPFQWFGQSSDPNAPYYNPAWTGVRGQEDVDYNGNGLWETGAAVQVAWTDSWDDNVPDYAQGTNYPPGAVPAPSFGPHDAFDGLRNFNQVRPGVFDGGYAFNDIPSGAYIVEVKAPPGYEIVKEEDKNVDFGDEYAGVSIPVNGNPAMPMGAPDHVSPAQGPLDKRPIAVGNPHLVPAQLTLFPGVAAPFAGQYRPLPDRKQVTLADGANAAADFFLFTEVPVAGQIVGFVLDDLSNEFDPNAPQFGEKYSPPFLPVSVRDWVGNVISYGLTDRYGAYNLLVPSTYTANIPAPSGYSPNILTVIINDADPNNPYGPASKKYSQFSYTFQYMPGTTTYLDTPVVPVAAFAGPAQFPVDVEFQSGTPVIRQVSGPGGGPYVTAGQQITISSLGTAVQVPNPSYDGTSLSGPTGPTVTRDYGFGPRNASGGRVGIVTLGGVPLAYSNPNWTATSITATVPAGMAPGRYQLVVTRADNHRASLLGVTVTVGPLEPGRTLRRVSKTPLAGEYATIQAAIDAANPGDLVLVGPGTYDELVIMYKPVHLQGWGAGVTLINAVQVPSEKIINWRNRIQGLWAAGAFDLLPAQELQFTGIEPALAAVEGAAVSLYARNASPADGGYGPELRARVDGFTIEGASTGGGIFANGYVRYAEISNNRIRQNSGSQGGGITIGHPNLVLPTAAGLEYQDAENHHIRIHNNQIASNGSLGGSGGGVSLYTGADFYELTDNLIAGNFSQGDGAGVGHSGRSDGGFMARNQIVFNQSFYQQTTVSGGGIFVAGGAPLLAGGLTEGSGSVSITTNLIQGNLAGAGDGGGIKVLWTLPGDLISITSNFIVNNVAGLAGGGIALQDAASVEILHNTIANNDSTATAGEAFLSANQSTPQPAGIASRQHSAAFQTLTGDTFSDPRIDSNIIWQNRSFYFQIVSPTDFGLQPSGYWDLGVLPASAGTLIPANSRLTGSIPAPPFVAPYVNVSNDPTLILPGVPAQAVPAFDEGGNFIDVRYRPLSIGGSDYHLDLSRLPAAQRSLFLAGLGGLDVDGDLSSAYVGADAYRGALENNPPVAVADTYRLEVTVVAGVLTGSLIIPAPGVLANDYDPDIASGLRFDAVVTSPAEALAFSGTTGGFTYTATNFVGVDSFTYRIADGPGASARYAVGTVTINVVDPSANSAPVPTAAPILTTIDTAGSTRVQPNDPDAGDTHTYALIAPFAVNGAASVSAAGSVSYTPNPGFVGSDSLTVSVTDNRGLSGQVTVAITVSLNLAPSLEMRVQLPYDGDGIDSDGDGILDNDNVYVLLGAGDGFTTMADGYQQYIFSFHDLSHLLPPAVPGQPVQTIPMSLVMNSGMLAAEFPAPTLRIREGQKLYLNLTNVGMLMRPDLSDPHTVHWHGFPEAASVFDGVPDASISVNMMSVLTYYYNVVWPGTYMYHCHVEATEHMQMGMLGNLYVLPRQDGTSFEYPLGSGRLYSKFAYNDGDGSTGYDVDLPVQIAGFDSAFHDASLTVQPLPFALMKDRYPMLNGRGYPDTIKPGSLVPPEANTYAVAVATLASADGQTFTITPVPVGGDMNGLDLVFRSGAPAGTSLRIATYTDNGDGSATVVLEEALSAAPAVGDSFDVNIGKASQNVSSRLEVTAGQRVLLRISSLDVTRYYTLASTLPLQVVGQSARLLRGPDGKNLYYKTNSVTLGGGESVDAIIDTAGVAPGTYLLYTSNLNYLSNNQEDFGGMMTEIVINP